MVAKAPLVIPALTKHTATIIFSHGLGDSAYGWESFARELSPRHPELKWVLTNASNKPVSINGGMAMPSWFDIKSLDSVYGNEDEKGMLASANYLLQLADAEEAQGISSKRIVIAGFSQGSVISLLAGLTSPKPLAGVIGLSGWLALSGKIESLLQPHSRDTPLFWGHGDSDPVVKYIWGQQSNTKLKELGFSKVNFQTYKGLQHGLCVEEQVHLDAFIRSVVPSKA